MIFLCPTSSPARYEEANSTSLKSCKGMCVALEQVERNIFMKDILYFGGCAMFAGLRGGLWPCVAVPKR